MHRGVSLVDTDGSMVSAAPRVEPDRPPEIADAADSSPLVEGGADCIGLSDDEHAKKHRGPP